MLNANVINNTIRNQLKCLLIKNVLIMPSCVIYFPGSGLGLGIVFSVLFFKRKSPVNKEVVCWIWPKKLIVKAIDIKTWLEIDDNSTP